MPPTAVAVLQDTIPQDTVPQDTVPTSLLTYADLPDDELVDRSRSGDTRALRTLLERYTSYARVKAKTYFLVGGDRDDIVQEGLIGLYKAIRDYDASKTVSFRAFAELCITRQVITAIKGATRQKHGPLNSYVSLHAEAGGEEGERRLVEFLTAARTSDPVEQVVAADEAAEIRAVLDEILSELEIDVLNLYMEGRSYEDIGSRLNRRAKSIDNALQRIKRKLESHLDCRERSIDDETNPRTAGRTRSGELRASLRFASRTAVLAAARRRG